MARVLRVGIIGANASGGWAGDAHVPAVKALEGLELAAVATNRRETADEAAHAFGVEKAYASGAALIADPDIDLVTVATRVPDHRNLLLAAIAVGKHVYSEWPLGRDSQESGELADAAKVARVHHAIGLQLRCSPAVRQARSIIASGEVGRVLSISTFSSTAGFGPDVPSQFAYLEDPAAFANLITIQGAHTLDLLIAVAGRPAFLSALTSRQFPTLRVGEDQDVRQRVTFDHLLIQGQIENGAPYALEVAGGRSDDQSFYLEIVGGQGTLRLDGGAPRGLQSGRIGLLLNGDRQPVDEGELAALADPAVNVAGVYAMLRNDIVRENASVTNFTHASRLTRLIEDVLTSSAREARLSNAEWPSE